MDDGADSVSKEANGPDNDKNNGDNVNDSVHVVNSGVVYVELRNI